MNIQSPDVIWHINNKEYKQQEIISESKPYEDDSIVLIIKFKPLNGEN